MLAIYLYHNAGPQYVYFCTVHTLYEGVLISP